MACLIRMNPSHPFLDPSFSIAWSALTADRLVPDLELALAAGKAAFDQIENLDDGEETFENTFLALEEAILKVSLPWGKVTLLDSVNDHPELRKAHKAMLPKVSAFFSAIPLNQALYRKLRHFSKSAGHASLDAVEKRFVEETLMDFEDAGANLDDPTRDRLQAIESLLSEKTKQYSEHVLDSTNQYQKIISSREALKGLPESFIEAARLNALKKGHGTAEEPAYRFTLQETSYGPAMRFLDSESLRQELYEAFYSRASSEALDNEPLIREIIALRAEKARLLGRECFPDWVLSRRMARSGKAALAFVEDLFEKTRTAFVRENEALEAYKAESTGGSLQPLKPWDLLYWSERLRRTTYDFDEELLRPYFPLPTIMTGLFALSERLFGIRVNEVTDPKPDAWHPEVQLFEVTDAATGHHMGSFYTDWFPRESKRGGAWMSSMVSGYPQADGALSPHLGFIGGNLTPPVGDQPALLNHRDVETVFHEFGHLLHHLLSEVKIRSLSGTNVTWDFVELPSQIMENWCWERESLDLFARHYETGDPIPGELFDRLLKARNFGAARMQMRQLFFGKMDLALHMAFDPEKAPDLDGFIQMETEGYLPATTPPMRINIRFFEHLFAHPTGYASGYYSYKWAEVLDADAFTRFTREGILNPETGKAFRQAVLARGNSEKPDKLYHAFMGRDPDPQALLIRLGLVAKG